MAFKLPRPYVRKSTDKKVSRVVRTGSSWRLPWSGLNYELRLWPKGSFGSKQRKIIRHGTRYVGVGGNGAALTLGTSPIPWGAFTMLYNIDKCKKESKNALEAHQNGQLLCSSLKLLLLLPFLLIAPHRSLAEDDRLRQVARPDGYVDR